MREVRVLAGLIFASLWAMLCAAGLLLEGRFHFLTTEAAVISARAILSAQTEPASLANLPMAHPPLPFFLALPFAWAGLRLPAIWVSSFFGALLCTWFFVHFRAHIARRPGLVLVVLAVALQPGVVHSSISGSSVICALALLTLSIYLMCRFALEQQTYEELRDRGAMSAWLGSGEYQSSRVRLLWTAALLLGLAGLGRFDLVVGLPIFLLATPFMLPRQEILDMPKIVTLALVLFLPLVAVQAMWGYLCWVFTGDFFHGIRHAASYFRQFDPEVFAVADATAPARDPVEILRNVGVGVFLACPVLPYLLVRLRNPAVALICAAPFCVEAAALVVWRADPAQSFFSLAYLLGAVLLLLGSGLSRFGRVEGAILVVAMLAGTAASWTAFWRSPSDEELAWRRLAERRFEELLTFRDEREMASLVGGMQGGKHRVFMDENTGFAILAVSNDASPFHLSYQRGFDTLAENPHLTADAILITPDDWSGRNRDRMALKWRHLEGVRKDYFKELHRNDSWLLLERDVTAKDILQ